jgi:transcriptional regulator with XRE-family HTH domain
MARTVGERIKEAQKAARVSNEALAAAAGVHIATVSQWRNDRQAPTDANLDAIAPLLRRSRVWLRYGGDAVAEAAQERAGEVSLPPEASLLLWAFLAELAQLGVPYDEIERERATLVSSQWVDWYRRYPEGSSPDEALTRGLADHLERRRAHWREVVTGGGTAGVPVAPKEAFRPVAPSARKGERRRRSGGGGA